MWPNYEIRLYGTFVNETSYNITRYKKLSKKHQRLEVSFTFSWLYSETQLIGQYLVLKYLNNHAKVICLIFNVRGNVNTKSIESKMTDWVGNAVFEIMEKTLWNAISYTQIKSSWSLNHECKKNRIKSDGNKKRLAELKQRQVTKPF